MSGNKPDKAFILGAGMGSRLRPLTEHTPKPLVKVAGKPIIDYVLDHLEAAGVSDVTVNTHYLAPLMERYLSRYQGPHINISREDVLLDTGGGIKKALPYLGTSPFYVVSGDSFWDNGTVPVLERLAAAWDPEKMDILILLQPVASMTLTAGVGDYDIVQDSRAARSKTQSGAYMWTSVRLCKPEVFDGAPEEAFSFLQLLDKVEAQGRLHGLVHDADWHHISTPEDLAITENYLRSKTHPTRAA